MQDRLNEYKYKCKVLKQIHSNKALYYGKINFWQNISTVIASAFITFIGFSGVDKLHTYVVNFLGEKAPGITVIEMIYNILVFILFVLVISHLVFQISKRQTDSEKAVSLLSNLINEIDDIDNKLSGNISSSEVDIVRYKYVTITQTIPSNTDKDFIKALGSLNNKKKDKKQVEYKNLVLLSKSEQEMFILDLIKSNSTVKSIIDNLFEVNSELYLGGGIIRNLVWDRLHNYKEMTPIEDIDVIYFDELSSSKLHDQGIEDILKIKTPNLNWSVKNQARMHEFNKEDKYKTIQDAIEKWPETVSAILVRKISDVHYELLAPFGYDDLFRLIIQPTPHFEKNLDRYRERIRDKKWLDKWSGLIAIKFEDAPILTESLVKK